ncbi:MAG: LacI family transcriptional regulator [Opitutales bacterium]|nr:LacI family transcriptional regulator [Opitutales bacterium]
MLKKSGKPNQQLIADRLNLSRTTVSRCFTHHPKINPETRAAVFQLAKELGYDYSQPRNVEGTNSELAERIEVLIGIPEDRKDMAPSAQKVFEGISEKAAAEKLQVDLHYVDPSQYAPSARARKLLPDVRFRDVKGVVLIYAFDEQTVQNLMGRLPVVSVFEDYDSTNVDCINPDQIRGISYMIEHLVGLGHREIGFLSWKYHVPAPWAERRLGAFVENLYRFNIPFEPKNVINMRRDEQVEPEQMVDMVAQRVEAGVRAWVCAADHQAYYLMTELEKRGIRVPQDVSITGFDGEKPPKGCKQMTTFEVPFRSMGISSVLSIQRRFAHPTDPRRQVLVDGVFKLGETTAIPRK